MASTYYEVRVSLSSYIEIIESILADALNSAVYQEDKHTLVLTVESTEQIKEKITEILEIFQENIQEKFNYDIEIEEKNQKDWVEEYQKNVKPVTVGGFFVRPEWIEEDKSLTNIIINPSLVFGTGDHFTTKSCIEAIDENVEKNDSFLDVGCGSGILAIVAAKKSAKVSLCDTDELAIINSKENFNLNDVSYEKIWVGSANNTDIEYDVVVANIVADVIVFIKKDLKKCVKANGILILSGILQKYEEKVLDAFSEFKVLDKKKDKEWVALVLKKEN